MVNNWLVRARSAFPAAVFGLRVKSVMVLVLTWKRQRCELSWVLFLLVFERIRDMSKRYSQEFKDRAVRLLSDRLAADRSCSQWRAVNEIAPKLGIANESLRRWYEQHLVNTGERQGLTREEHEEIKRLKRENAELRRANEILKTASAFFAAELDRPAR